MEFRFTNAASVGEAEIHPFHQGGKSLLLVRQGGRLYCLDNKCGHFGAPLATGKLTQGAIQCEVHGISFSLETGQVVNRPWERCRSLGVYPVREEGGDALVDLPDA
ncbi:MAG: Rieske 2Fe-2S domain-containing protein [Gammaproteobacteria bacterium]|nr:Rieske 2Fe-2S domain-containing protein [Gammaproteobacteria bacterium]MBU1654974.1 Rieske 2Fe-2S domain-containing protein [Gammaproteobacteria bacterium]MBU1960060.1 Rieske 2Fe-2S domain-containing protein [Gammaproteobacteria bacterium]